MNKNQIRADGKRHTGSRSPKNGRPAPLNGPLIIRVYLALSFLLMFGQPLITVIKRIILSIQEAGQ